LTIKIKITEKVPVIKDQNQRSLLKTDLDQRSKIAKRDLKSCSDDLRSLPTLLTTA